MNSERTFNPHTEPIAFLLRKLGINSPVFTDKVVFITGGAGGIGEQIAKGLAFLGAKIAIIDKMDIGHSVSNYINENKGESIFIKADISKKESLKMAIEHTFGHFGKIDILINNAVHFVMKSILETTEEEWDYSFATNVKAPFIASKMVLPGMMERKYGIILNMIALEGMANAAAMSASKVALRSLNFSLAAEIPENSNVSVMGFAPGLVATPRIKKILPEYCKTFNQSLENYILTLKNIIGYEGLMPSEHCASSLISCLTKADEFNGLIADPFLPLEKAGILSKHNLDSVENEELDYNLKRLKEYISEVTQINKKIEEKVALRTETLKKENAYSFKLLRALKEKSNELEYSKRLLENNQRSLERSNEDLSQFAHIVSHDLKAPLRAINSLIIFIEEDLGKNLPLDVKQNFSLIRARIKRMESLISGILEYSKVGIEESSNELTDFNELLDHVQFMLNIPDSFTVKIASDLPEIYGNRIQFQQIFQNLISNAIKYHHKEKGHIEVGFEEYPGEYKFWVKDDGPGIKEQFQEKIFGIFQTLQPRDKIESTGVGLSIIKKIIQQHGGSIWVESDGETGSTFYFKLPKNKIAA